MQGFLNPLDSKGGAWQGAELWATLEAGPVAAYMSWSTALRGLISSQGARSLATGATTGCSRLPAPSPSSCQDPQSATSAVICQLQLHLFWPRKDNEQPHHGT